MRMQHKTVFESLIRRLRRRNKSGLTFAALALVSLAFVSLALTGCNKASDKPNPSPSPTKISGEGNAHEGWWCDEHGVPEEVCAQCDLKLTAEFKAKGDWCNDHDRPDSQCFVCHPEKQAEFAAQYEAKYGKQPPKPQL